MGRASPKEVAHILHHRLTSDSGANTSKAAGLPISRYGSSDALAFFITAKLASQTGEQAKPETPRGFHRTARALLLSYAFTWRESGGIRTRDLVVAIEVTDLFTTGSALVLSGNAQTRFQPHQHRASRACSRARNPRRDGPREAASMGHVTQPAGWGPAFPGAKHPRSSPPTKCIQGNERRRRQARFAVEVSRVFTTWNSNSPWFPHDKGFGAAGNKNPSGAWAREGFEHSNL